MIARAEQWRERQALVSRGKSYTYAKLLHASGVCTRVLLPRAHASSDLAGANGGGSREDLAEARVVYALEPGFEHVALQWAIWRAGGVAVPLSSSQSPAEWQYIVEDTRAAVVVGNQRAEGALRPIAERRGARYLNLNAPGDIDAGGIRLQLDSTSQVGPSILPDGAALILYTSGTTSRPKGVVITHANLAAQIATLVDAWQWSERDHVLHVLPLNHVHGIVNILGCALWAGACCEFLSPFDARAVWDRFAGGGLTLFMAVPTIYAKLMSAWDAADATTRARWAEGARALRLMVSGSAALPVTVLQRWRAITGHVLLERYGMTEIGMALSNPLDGPRRPGLVGTPLPGVRVRIVDEQGHEAPAGTPGEIEVQGPGVFREYWRRPDATRTAFRDGWFRTGDVAVVEEGSYRILGRSSVDIIKTGGYKVSALEIEEALRQHPAIAECAVVGLPDEEWGERVAVAVVARARASAGLPPCSLEELRAWASSRLATYKLPTRLVTVAALPRNAMGKVTKAKVKELFVGENARPGTGD